VKDSFDTLMGKRRGVSPVHERERLRHLHQTAWRLLRDQGLSEEAVQALSGLATCAAADVQDRLRGVIRERVRAVGLVSFATDWKWNLGSLSDDLDDALQEAVIAILAENTQSGLSKLTDASYLIENFFLDKETAWMSGPELITHRPLVKAIARACKQALPNGDYTRKRMADCLGAYASAFLLPLSAWRDELTEEISAGYCDNDLNTLETALRCRETEDVLRQDFLKDLNDAIERRREVLKQRVSWLEGTGGALN